MTAATKTKAPRKKKPLGYVVPEPEAIFVPVHAESMSTPIFKELERELGEPDLNPYEDELPTFAKELIKLHTPDLSMRQQVPAWAMDTGQYLVDRIALHNWRARMAQEKADKEADRG